jgi:hypothetical protein
LLLHPPLLLFPCHRCLTTPPKLSSVQPVSLCRKEKTRVLDLLLLVIRQGRVFGWWTPFLPLFCFSLPASVLILPPFLCSASPSLPLLCYSLFLPLFCYSLPSFVLLLHPCTSSKTPSLPLFCYFISPCITASGKNSSTLS